MKTTQIIVAGALIVGSGLTLAVVQAQQAGIKRTDLQRHDLGGSGVRQTLASGGRDRLCPRRLLGVSGRGPAVDHAQRRRRPVHPGPNHPCGNECRPGQGGGARHIHSGKREAAGCDGEGSGRFELKRPRPDGRPTDPSMQDGPLGVPHTRLRPMGSPPCCHAVMR